MQKVIPFLKSLFNKPAAGTPSRAVSSYMDRLRQRRDAEDAMVVVRQTGGMKIGTLIWLNGGEEWFLNDKLHRDGAPAIIKADGTRMWFKRGLLHNDNGPAIQRADGTTEWWKDGEPVKAPPDATVTPLPPTPAQKALSEMLESVTHGTSGKVVVSQPLKLKKPAPQ